VPIAVPDRMNYRYQVGTKGQRHKGTKFFFFPLCAFVPLCLCASVPVLSVAYPTGNRYKERGVVERQKGDGLIDEQ